MSAFSEWFRSALISRELSTRDFADRSGASKSTVAGVAGGSRPPPLSVVDQWAKLLLIPPDELDRWRLLAVAAHAPRDLHDRIVAMADRLARYERGQMPVVIPAGAADQRNRPPVA